MSEEQVIHAAETESQDTPSYPFPFAPHSLDIPPEYEHLRNECPVSKVHMPHGGDAFFLARYDDIAKAFSDPRCGMIQRSDGDVPRLETGVVTGTSDNNASLFSVSDARHNKLRRTVTQAFTVQAANKLRPRVVEVTHALVDAMERSGAPADLFEDYAIQTPMTVLCELLGVPRQEEKLLREAARAIISTTVSPEEQQAQRMKLVRYLTPAIEQARTNPGENVLGLLARAHEQGDEVMTAPEMYAFAIGLIAAGFETVSTTFTNSAFIVLQKPEVVAELRVRLEQPDDLSAAIEELIRVTPIGAGRPRITRDSVQFGETAVPAGEVLMLSTLAANHDASVFPDANSIRFDREIRPILSFGRGIHACLGQQIARMEMQVLWHTLLTRLPAVHLAVAPSEVPWRPDETLTSGPAHLPVSW